MRGGVAWRAGGLVLALLRVAVAHAESPAEVRVLSGTSGTTTLTVRATPDVTIEDKTTGARPAGPTGPASSGETFSDELTILLRPPVGSRAASIEVNDPLVSAVRLFPEPGGTTVTVFIRQPVTYSVSRPSATGEVRIELHTRARPATVTVTQTQRRQRVKVTRPEPTGEGEVAVDAESLSYDKESNTLTARGSVTLTRGDSTLTADEVVYDRTNSIAEARGHVVITDPQAEVAGTFAHLNMDDETGWIENADATLEPTRFRLGGNRLEKLGGPRYTIANGVFTTCECGGLEKPSWSVVGKRTDIELDGMGVMHGMTFRIKDQPALYLPYFLFPANTQRATGALMPRISYSNRRGFQYEQPFFWAISKSTDATVAVDIETKARAGLLGEYRYRLTQEARGAFLFGYWNEQIRGRPTGTIAPNGLRVEPPDDRFLISGHHVMPFYGDGKFYLDLFAVSDDTLLKEINSFSFDAGHNFALRTTRYTTSRAGAIKTWPEGVAWIENEYSQDLVDPQELALQKLPRVTGEHGTTLLDGKAVARVSAEGVNFQREQGYDGLRADLAPELFLPFSVRGVLNGSVTGTLRETAYHLTNDRQVALVTFPEGKTVKGDAGTGIITKRFREAPELPALDPDHTREIAELQGRTGTQFERVFTFRHLGLEKLKHTIEPEVQYLFVPQVSRPITDLPRCADVRRPVPGVNCNKNGPLFAEGYLFDERDAINRRNFVSYGITSRLLGRPPTADETAAAQSGEHEGKAPVPLDPETLPQGLPLGAVQNLPQLPPAPTPPAPGTPAAPAAPPRELLRASILHGYDITRTLSRDSHESDVDLGVRLTPVDYFGLVYNTTVNLQEGAIRGITLGGVLREPWWAPTNVTRNYQSPTTVGFSYRFIENSVNRGIKPGTLDDALFRFPTVNEIDGSFYLRLGEYMGFTFLSRYDLATDAFLGRDYLFRVISRCNCWVLEAGVSDQINPDERLYRVQFTLIGLGGFGRSPATRNYVGLAPLSSLGLRRPAALGSAVGY